MASHANVKVPPSAKIALDALYEAIAESGEVVSGGGIPLKTRTIPVVRWREVCEAKMIADSEKPDSKYKAFVRASKRLQQTCDHWRLGKIARGSLGQAGQART